MKCSKRCYKCMCIVHIHTFIRVCRKYNVFSGGSRNLKRGVPLVGRYSMHSYARYAIYSNILL